MRTGTHINLLFLLCIIFLLPGSSTASAACRDLSMSADGRITIPPGSCPAGEVLSQISNLAGLDVLVIGDCPLDRRLERSFEKSRPGEVIRSLLIGCSYAIIYHNKAKGRVSSVLSTDRSASAPQPGTLSSASVAGAISEGEEYDSTRIQERESQLIAKINELRERIESGKSDEVYNRIIEVRDPLYVVHDQVNLEFFENELMEYRLKGGVE